MRSYRFVIFIEPADGHFLARCPALDGLIGTGRTPEEARTVLLATLYGYLRDLARQGQPIPTDESFAETVHVLMPA
jgi:predicted RNase H-like HicB family nuclease